MKFFKDDKERYEQNAAPSINVYNKDCLATLQLFFILLINSLVILCLFKKFALPVTDYRRGFLMMLYLLFGLLISELAVLLLIKKYLLKKFTLPVTE